MNRLNPFPDLVTLQWMFDTRRETLRQLFAPHRAFFRGFVDLDAAQHSHDWKIDAHRALSQPERIPPLDLIVALAQVMELAQPDAHRALLDLAAAERVELGPDGQLFGPNDVAIRFLRHRPELFFGTLAQRRTLASGLTFEASAKAASEPALRLAPWRLARLRAALVAHDQERRRSRYLGVQTVETEQEITFVITRGLLSRIYRSSVRESLVANLVRPLRFDYDFARYDRCTHRLEIRARRVEEARFLACALGKVFHRDAEHYRPSSGSAPQQAA